MITAGYVLLGLVVVSLVVSDVLLIIQNPIAGYIMLGIICAVALFFGVIIRKHQIGP